MKMTKSFKDLYNLLVVVCLVNTAAKGDAMARVRDEYPSALKHLNRTFSHVNGSFLATIRTWKTDAPGEVSTRVWKMKFVVDGPRKKLEKINITDDGSSKTYKRLYCVTPNLSFYIVQQDPKATQTIKQLVANSDDALLRNIDQSISHCVESPFRAFFRIDRIFEEWTVKLQRSSYVNVNGSRLIEAEYLWSSKPGKVGPLQPAKLTLLLSPDEGWALYAYEIKTSKSTLSGTVEYEKNTQKSITPKRVTEKTNTSENIFEIQKFILGASTPDEFTLAAVGLPNIDVPGKNRSRSNAGLWFFGLALLGFSAAFALAAWNSRRHRVLFTDNGRRS
jgi:hypothetical protein